MAVIATLVVGANHATSLGGLSAPLSTPADRARFLTLHRRAGAIIIGRESAAIENYQRTKVPIFVYSRNSAPLTFSHPLMQQVTVDRNLGELTKVLDERIVGDIVIESGASLLVALIKTGVVDEIELTLSPIAGDGHFVDPKELLQGFEIIADETIEGTRLLKGRDKRNSSNGEANS